MSGKRIPVDVFIFHFRTAGFSAFFPGFFFTASRHVMGPSVTSSEFRVRLFLKWQRVGSYFVSQILCSHFTGEVINCFLGVPDWERPNESVTGDSSEIHCFRITVFSIDHLYDDLPVISAAEHCAESPIYLRYKIKTMF
jgi:hypothetical protein